MSQRRTLVIIIDVFIGFTVLALIVTLYLSIARATITMPVATTDFKSTATLTIGTEGSDVPGTFVTKDYERTVTVPVGGTLTTSTKAGGFVTLINKSTKSQSLVKTTRLLTTDDILFRIQQTITVPAQGKIDVFAEADEDGDAYLVSPTKFTIPGLWEGLQELIYAESSAAMSYERRMGSVVTKDDVNHATEKLNLEIAAAAAKDLATDTVPLRASDVTVTITTVNAEPPVSESGSSVTVTVKATAKALLVDQSALRKAAQDKIVRQLPDASSFIEIQPDSFSYSVDAIDTEKAQAAVTATLAAWVRSGGAISSIDLKQLTGKTKQSALDYLESHGIKGATISVRPFWMPTLPLLQTHISISTK